MKKPRKQTSSEATGELGEGLTSLFETLNDAIGDVISRLDDAQTGSVTRAHVFETTKGPMRAQAGINVRFAAQDVAEEDYNPRPVNTPEAASAPEMKGAAARHIPYDIIEDANQWILTADMPGVATEDLSVNQTGNGFEISTAGGRQNHARVALQGSFVFDAMNIRLSNGILTITIPKEDAK